MEKEEKIKEKETPRPKRRLSLFKRRKKPEIRPFVKEKKSRQGKKLFFSILGLAFSIFLITGLLFTLKNLLLDKFFV